MVLEVGSVWRGGAGVVDAHQDDAALVLLQARHAQKALLRVDQRVCLGDERGFVHVDRRVQRKGEKLLARVQDDAHEYYTLCSPGGLIKDLKDPKDLNDASGV